MKILLKYRSILIKLKLNLYFNWWIAIYSWGGDIKNIYLLLHTFHSKTWRLPPPFFPAFFQWLVCLLLWLFAGWLDGWLDGWLIGALILYGRVKFWYSIVKQARLGQMLWSKKCVHSNGWTRFLLHIKKLLIHKKILNS